MKQSYLPHMPAGGSGENDPSFPIKLGSGGNGENVHLRASSMPSVGGGDYSPKADLERPEERED